MSSTDPVVLLTGFAPFAGEVINPSWQAVRALDGETIDGHRVTAIELPTEFDKAISDVRRAIRRLQPAFIIAVGLAGGRNGISLERVAINLIDARIPDNSGAQPIDQPIARHGPAAYLSTLPIKAALGALHDADIDAHISQTAGTYVCNAVFYALMHAARRKPMRAGFVHVPYLPEQAQQHAAPGMLLNQMIDALRIIVLTALTTRHDSRVTGGAES